MNLPPPASAETTPEGEAAVELVLLSPPPEEWPTPRKLEIFARAIQSRFSATFPHPDVRPDDLRRGARQEAVLYTLVQCGFLQNEAGQRRRLVELYPVIEASVNQKSPDDQLALVDELNSPAENPVMRTIDEFGKLTRNYEDAQLMQFAAAFLIQRFSEQTGSTPEISQA